MLARAFLWLALLNAGDEVRDMLVRLYAGEIIAETLTEDRVPAKLRERVHQYLEDLGYYDEQTANTDKQKTAP